MRLHVEIRGAVQGVGFRPFIYRLAHELELDGWVNNSTLGVVIEAEGTRNRLESFMNRMRAETPPRAVIQVIESSYLNPIGYAGFQMRESESGGRKVAPMLPDIGTCDECLTEVCDPSNRRWLYPFSNCTNCGPRYTIIEALPYDRANTTMKAFAMCDECRREYEDPGDRRFHAQPIACPACGPHLELWNQAGTRLESHRDALLAAANAIRDGLIVAIKGLGGFHLVVDARNDAAVRKLRQKKNREEKPFAVMCPSVEQVLQHCRVSDQEQRLLTSPEKPIVLVRKRRKVLARPVSDAVAPRNPYLGVMLPYTPLHSLLLLELGFPIVATSGNRCDEPICIDENEALTRLSGIADLFLVHDRPIIRHVDDSVVRVVLGREMFLRRARGYAPLPITISGGKESQAILAMGAHLKNTVALAVDRDVFLSQHIGDLETAEAFKAFEAVIQSFKKVYDSSPSRVAADRHPDYLSTRYALSSGLPVVRVQHHFAHVLSCMADNELEPPVLGIAWDGTGYGGDGTIWGGEFLRVPPAATSCAYSRNHAEDAVPFQRVAHLRAFRLPGGDAAAREPRRSALAVLYELLGAEALYRADLAPIRAFSTEKRKVIQRMLRDGINSPLTSSAGRLFDAVASILNLRQLCAYEGQAAAELEFALDEFDTDARYEFELVPDASTGPANGLIVDWGPTIRQILKDQARQLPVGQISARFHNTLVAMILAVATRIGEERVVISGGCFQNKYLTERTIRALRDAGFTPYWHRRVPPNDGGISLGQVVAASSAKEN